MSSFAISLGIDCNTPIERGLISVDDRVRPLQLAVSQIDASTKNDIALASSFNYQNGDDVLFRVVDITSPAGANQLGTITKLTIALLDPATGELYCSSEWQNPFDAERGNPFEPVISGTSSSRQSSYFMGVYPTYDGTNTFTYDNGSTTQAIKYLLQAILEVTFAGSLDKHNFGVDPEMVVGPGT